MKLRTSILLILLLFAVVPTLLFVAFSLPLMLDRLQSFYHQAHLQNLRADFRDLDEHLASRREMTRVLSKLPEPGIVVGGNSNDTALIDEGRVRYTEWVNGVFGEQLDVVGIVFLNKDLTSRFWLARAAEGAPLRPTTRLPDLPDQRMLEGVLNGGHAGIFVSPVHTSVDANNNPHPRLHLVAPIHSKDEVATAIVVTTIDIGGLANAYRSTLWLDNQGRYIGRKSSDNSNAFDDYAGLEQLMTENRITLWQDPEQGQIIWIPMFRSADGEPLWVGRVVGKSPIADLWQNLLMRGLLIAVPVLIGIWLVARRVTLNIDSIGHSLSNGVREIIAGENEVKFKWKRPVELKEVGDNLNRLSITHARNQRNLLMHTRELEESNKFKSEFLANVSHELKTPLNSILVLSKLIKENPSIDSESREQATIINSAGRDLHRLIENILELSLLERMDQHLSLEETNLKQLVIDTVELMRPLYQEKSLELNIEFGRMPTSRIVTDSGKLKQVLRNLLTNALKFTESGGVTINVQINDQAVSNKPPVMIRVKDTGMGIAPHEQKRIFDAFRQADGSIRRRFGGTGLGLNISQRLVHLLGGTISVSSELGKGSTFIVKLPLEYVPQTQVIAPAEESEAGISVSTQKIDEANYMGRRILIIDDDVDHLLELSRILSRWNIDALIASDEEEIREAVLDNPDCILTIINRSLCNSSKCDSISALMNSNQNCMLIALDNGDTSQDEKIPLGFDAELTFPIDAARLKSLIDKQLDL